MAAPPVGSIGEFNMLETDETWDIYTERLALYLEANAVTEDAKKRTILLTVCGSKTYQVIRSLTSPDKPTAKSFDELVKLLAEHFSPKPSEIVQRFKFHKRDQGPEESIAQYSGELRKIAETCNFGNNLNEMLRDRIVCGIKNEALQRRLLAESKLDLKGALEIATAAETAETQTLEIRNGNGKTYKVSDTISSKRSGDKNDSRHNVKHPASPTSLHTKHNLYPYQKTPFPRFCFRCEGAHRPEGCRFKTSKCRACGKAGHIEKACLSKRKGKRYSEKNNQMHNINRSDTESEEEGNLFAVKRLGSIKNVTEARVLDVQMCMNGKTCTMEIDSGASYSVISETKYQEMWPQAGPQIRATKVQLRDYQQNRIDILGECLVDIRMHGHEYHKLPLIITKGNTANLLGRNWFSRLGIKFVVNQIQAADLNSLVQQYAEIFDGKLGKYKGPPVKLELKPEVKAITLKARNIAYALKPKIEAEIQKLVDQGILEPIEQAEWSTPIVPVIKADGVNVRICGDYKCTINKALRDNHYPMPNATEIFASLQNAKIFARLDMSQAYQQLTVDEESAKLQTIITHKGLFTVNRLQFGVKVAPQIFQMHINRIFSTIPGIHPYYDDILIAAETSTQLKERLEAVFKKCITLGLKLNKQKCIFNAESIEFLGCIVDANGIRPTNKKIAAIRKAPVPTNRKQLQSFLGFINFYHHFMKNKADVAEPLHKLLTKEEKWHWGPRQDAAFQAMKELLTSDSFLVRYNEQRPVVLACDASPWGVGAVLSHSQNNGVEVPIAFHSKSLSKAQQKYAQLDKEALAMVTGVKKFHNYLYGRSFTIITDHKPLLGLLGEDRPIPELSSPRLVRWALFLSNYNYKLEYRPGKEIAHADALSRWPELENGEQGNREKRMGNVLMMENLSETPLHVSKLAELTNKDTVLEQVIKFIQSRWPKTISDVFKPYFSRKDELTTYRDCLLWGNRVVIPGAAQKQVLTILHSTHVGMVRMKALARSYCWWPGLDGDIENTVNTCEACQENQKLPPKSKIHAWEWETQPWTRIHIDFAGPFKGQVLLIVVDAYSKFTEVRRVPTTSTKAAVKELRQIFATFGLPEVMVSDNGTAFTSREFKAFLQSNGIRHVTTPPYHPASNGQAERMVQEVKRSLSKLTEGDWDTKLARYLLKQHSTPSTTTRKSPAELMMQRKLRTHIDLGHPGNNNDKRNDRQERTDKGDNPKRVFDAQDKVWVRNYGTGNKWKKEAIWKKTGPVTYKTADKTGRIVLRHIDHMRKRWEKEEEEMEMGEWEAMTFRRHPIEQRTGPRTEEHRIIPVPKTVEIVTQPTGNEAKGANRAERVEEELAEEEQVHRGEQQGAVPEEGASAEGQTSEYNAVQKKVKESAPAGTKEARDEGVEKTNINTRQCGPTNHKPADARKSTRTRRSPTRWKDFIKLEDLD